MLRNIVAGKAAIGPLTTSNSKILTDLNPKESSRYLIPKLNDFKSYLKLEIPLPTYPRLLPAALILFLSIVIVRRYLIS